MTAAWTAYLRDVSQHAALIAGVLRGRPNLTVAHDAAGNPPVLVYAYEVVMEARGLLRSSNYRLLRILPPERVELHPSKHP